MIIARSAARHRSVVEARDERMQPAGCSHDRSRVISEAAVVRVHSARRSWLQYLSTLRDYSATRTVGHSVSAGVRCAPPRGSGGARGARIPRRFLYRARNCGGNTIYALSLHVHATPFRFTLHRLTVTRSPQQSPQSNHKFNGTPRFVGVPGPRARRTVQYPSASRRAAPPRFALRAR